MQLLCELTCIVQASTSSSSIFLQFFLLLYIDVTLLLICSGYVLALWAAPFIEHNVRGGVIGFIGGFTWGFHLSSACRNSHLLHGTITCCCLVTSYHVFTHEVHVNKWSYIYNTRICLVSTCVVTVWVHVCTVWGSSVWYCLKIFGLSSENLLHHKGVS